MRELRLSFTFAAAALVVAACGNDMPFDPEDPRLEDARLEIIGSSAVNLGHGDTAELRVRYVAADGSVISNAPIDYEIQGDGAGSRLAALQTATNADGEAAMDLTAGDANAMFTVHVSVSGQDTSVDFSVAVSDVAVGSIVVSMTYPGSRELVRFDTFLLEAESCDALDPMDLPTALRMAPSVSDISAMPAFAGVPEGSDYTVAVTARNATALAAFGCRDGIGVTADEETPVNITLNDLEIMPSFVGVWDLDNRFDFAEGLPPTVRTAIDILDELTDDVPPAGMTDPPFCYHPPTADPDDYYYGHDPGAFIVDVAARQTCAWECMSGDTYETCSDREYPANNHRLGDLRLLCVEGLGASASTISSFSGGCGAWDLAAEPAAGFINDQLNSFLPSFVNDWANFAGDLARAINQARIASVLTINAPAAGSEFDLPMTHELISMEVRLRDPLMGGAERSFEVALADAGLTNLEVTEMTTVDGTTLNIPEHSFTISFGRLVQYIYNELILGEILGFTSSTEMLESYIDCAAIGMNLADSVGGLSETQYTNACSTALGAVGSLLDTQIAGLIDADATFTISGTAVGMDIDESTGRVDTLGDGMWTGYWGEDDMTSDLTGTFTGARRASD